ncbi:uncharacterized protein BKA78DRAFT_303289 [Phyllosticta capitalensis]|uniref:uncharacterized protein n=1 Tax=Phyllosticta capitalensis TaxID=121624 RepID=UPI00312DFF6B
MAMTNSSATPRPPSCCENSPHPQSLRIRQDASANNGQLQFSFCPTSAPSPSSTPYGLYSLRPYHPLYHHPLAAAVKASLHCKRRGLASALIQVRFPRANACGSLCVACAAQGRCTPCPPQPASHVPHAYTMNPTMQSLGGLNCKSPVQQLTSLYASQLPLSASPLPPFLSPTP